MPDVSLSTEGVWSELRANIRGFIGRRVRQPADVDDIVQRVIVLVNGEELGHGAYPRREDMARASGLVASASQTKPRIRLSAEGCCTPGSGCC